MTCSSAIFIFNLPVPEMAGSIALQALIPARHIGAKALYFGGDMEPNAFLDAHSPRVLIITKMFDDGPLALARAALQRGTKIISVFCDLHVADAIGQRNKELCDLANAAIAPTAPMASLVRQHFNKPCSVIEEPVEYPRGAPRFVPSKPLRILWLGHASNHDTLVDGMSALARVRSWPLMMMLVSGQPPNLQMLQSIAPTVPLRSMPWSPLIQFAMLSECDLVFIPSKDDPSKHAKGQARLVAAIQAGRVSVAHPLPQYEELSAFCYCTRDYARGIEHALPEPSAALARVIAGQREIDARFSQEAVAAKWLTLINGLEALM